MISDKLERIEELEKELSYLVNDSMTLEEKLKSLSGAYWEASHSGYGDAMANKLMGGEEDDQREITRIVQCTTFQSCTAISLKAAMATESSISVFQSMY